LNKYKGQEAVQISKKKWRRPIIVRCCGKLRCRPTFFNRTLVKKSGTSAAPFETFHSNGRKSQKTSPNLAVKTDKLEEDGAITQSSSQLSTGFVHEAETSPLQAVMDGSMGAETLAGNAAGTAEASTWKSDASELTSPLQALGI